MANEIGSIIDKFTKFETNNNLFSISHCSVKYWNLIRFSLFNRIIHGDKVSNIHPDSSHKNKYYIVNALIASIRMIVYWNINRCKKDKERIYLLNYTGYEMPVKLGYVNRIFQAIIDSKDYYIDNIYHLSERQFHLKNIYKYKNNGDIIFAYFFRYVYEKIILRRREDIDGLSSILEKFNQEFDMDIGLNEIDETVRTSVRAYNHYYRYYISRLRKRKYKCVVLSAYYCIEGYALISAARDLGITSIEFQHGIPSDCTYIFNQNVGRDCIFADVYLSYGQYWNDIINIPSWSLSVIVGQYIIDYEKSRYLNINKKLGIVFYSQGPSGDIIYNFIMEYINKYNRQNLPIILKLHPSEYITWRERYPLLEDLDNVSVIDYPCDTYELLANYEIHVGVYSTVLYEATSFSNKIYVIDNPLAEYMSGLTDIGLASIIYNGQDLDEAIERDIYIHNDKSEYFFANDSCKRVLEVLRNIR